MPQNKIEFVPKSYGSRLTKLFIVRSIAIWCVAIFPLCMALAAFVWHEKQINGLEWAGIIGVLFAAIAVQLWAISAWRQADLRKVVWDPQSQEVVFSNHRFVDNFFSFGQLRERVSLALPDIQTVKRVRGRGQYLRLQTREGFVCVTNDLQPFEQLCQLLIKRRD